MGLIKVVVEDAVENQFRKTAMERFGYAKGSLSQAAEQAFSQWTQQEQELAKELESIGDPIDAVSGMLKHIKKSSLQLQHEIKGLWSAKDARHRR